jgi:hypothetical protein
MENQITEQKESIKLIKGQKDNYGWEVKILPINGLTLSQEDLDRLNNLNNQLKLTYGQDEK